MYSDGRLDFYKTEQDYLDHQNPINKKPYKMWQFNVETDARYDFSLFDV
jgi:hypothetical protein